MLVVGCDVGSLTAKAVIMADGRILSAVVIRAKTRPEESAAEVMDKALAEAGLARKDVGYTVGTGYGRKKIPFADELQSEIVCHGKGVQWFLPGVRTVIDVGGQDAKAVRVDETGRVVRYVYNDKCASGTGRFLEVMAEALGVRLEDMGELSVNARAPVKISNQCVVFAETEVISLVNDGKAIPDIVCGLHRAMAHRVASLVKGIGAIERDVAMSGGVAKNVGMYSAIEEALGVPLQAAAADPQLMGAVGAALLAAASVKMRSPGNN